MSKLLLLILSLFVFLATSSAQTSLLEQDVEIESLQGSIGSLLSDIGQAGGFTFSYGHDIPQNKRARLSSNRKSVQQFLFEMLGDGYYFVEFGNKILLKRKHEISEKAIIRGRVVDSESREALPGVTVYLPETDPLIGVVSDANGYFQIEVPAGLEIIRFSSIGYEQRSLKPGENNKEIIELDPSRQEIAEVFIDYFTIPVDKTINFAQGYISNEEINNIQLNSIDEALQGNVPGIHAIRQTGMPGANIQVKIRGNHSLINSEPEYYLNGMPVQKAVLEAISPMSIGSIDILKDASGTAIYGAAGGNGIVLLNSKEEERKGFHVSLEYYTGMQKIWKQYDLLTGPEFKAFYELVFPKSTFIENWDSTYQTDWLNELFHEGGMEEYHLSLSGKNDHSSLVLDLGYFNHSAMIKDLSLNRYSASLNGKHKIGERLRIKENITAAYLDYLGIKEGSFMSDYSNTILNTLLMLPTYDSIGPSIGRDGSLPHPNDDIELTGNTRKNKVILGSVSIEYDLTQNIIYKARAGLEVLNQDIKSYTNSPPIFIAGPEFDFYRNEYSIQDLTIDLNQELEYNFEMPVNHGLVTKLGYEYESVSSNWIPHTQLHYDSRELFYDTTSVADTTKYYQSLQYMTDYTKHAAYATLSYNFHSRYFLDLVLRRDAVIFPFNDNIQRPSSWFPSVSVGWLFSDEELFGESDFLEYGKLRTGMGKAGISPKLNYSHYAQMTRELEYLVAFDTDPGVGMKNSALLRQSSEQFYWEDKTSFNIGLDLGFFRNKLFVSFDYFYGQLNMGELYPADNPLAFISELSQRRYYKINYPPNARIVNKGLELELNYKESFAGFSSNLGFHIAHMNNEIREIADLPMSFLYNEDYDIISANIPGNQANSFYGYKIERLFTEEDIEDGEVFNQPYIYHPSGTNKIYAQPDATVGDYKFMDLNNDSIIDQHDKTILGNPLPDLTFGFSWHAEYKGFDLTLLIQGTYGNEIFNTTRLWLMNPYGKTNWSREILDSWRSPVYDNDILIDPGNTDTDLHRIDQWNTNRNMRISDLFIEDGSYLRIKNLQLGYTINPSWTEKVWIERLRIYVAAKNLYTLTKYSGLDPEIGGWGVDCGIYPQPRTYMFGVNLDF